MKNVISSIKRNGLTSRRHGNTGRTPKHSLSFETKKEVVQFLVRYTIQHGLVLPGRVPGFSKTDIKLLLSAMSKSGIWKTYRKALPSGNVPVAYSTYCQLWQDLVPDLVVMKPMTDLCLECQQHIIALQRCTNQLPQDKSATLATYSNHLKTVHLERTYFNMQVDMCKQSLKEYLTSRGIDKFPPL